MCLTNRRRVEGAKTRSGVLHLDAGGHEEGVSRRINLGARLGPALTACIGLKTGGVRASRLMHTMPGPAWCALCRVDGYAG